MKKTTASHLRSTVPAPRTTAAHVFTLSNMQRTRRWCPGVCMAPLPACLCPHRPENLPRTLANTILQMFWWVHPVLPTFLSCFSPAAQVENPQPNPCSHGGCAGRLCWYPRAAGLWAAIASPVRPPPQSLQSHWGCCRLRGIPTPPFPDGWIHIQALGWPTRRDGWQKHARAAVTLFQLRWETTDHQRNSSSRFGDLARRGTRLSPRDRRWPPVPCALPARVDGKQDERVAAVGDGHAERQRRRSWGCRAADIVSPQLSCHANSLWARRLSWTWSKISMLCSPAIPLSPWTALLYLREN